MNHNCDNYIEVPYMHLYDTCPSACSILNIHPAGDLYSELQSHDTLTWLSLLDGDITQYNHTALVFPLTYIVIDVNLEQKQGTILDANEFITIIGTYEHECA